MNQSDTNDDLERLGAGFLDFAERAAANFFETDVKPSTHLVPLETYSPHALDLVRKNVTMFGSGWNEVVRARTERDEANSLYAKRRSERHSDRAWTQRFRLGPKNRRALDHRLDDARASYSAKVREAQRVEANLSEALESVVLRPALSDLLPPEWGSPSEDDVILKDGEGLSSKATGEDYYQTRSHQRVAVALTRRGGATVGLAGIRGAGKSELANHFATTSDTRIGVRLWAPASTDARSFLLWLAKTLSLEVLLVEGGSGLEWDPRVSSALRRFDPLSPLLLAFISATLWVAGVAILVGDVTGYDIREDKTGLGIGLLVLSAVVLIGGGFARQRRREEGGSRSGGDRLASVAGVLYQRVTFTETVEAGVEVSGDILGALNLSSSAGTAFAANPLTELDLVSELRDLVGAIRRSGREVVVAIDEVDKMSSDEDAKAFINRIKMLFPIEGCSFIVSVSDHAWVSFTRRGVSFRDAFDSSFDEVVHVGPLGAVDTRNLLMERQVPITNLQALFVHGMTGGLPRDTLRAARQLARVADRLQEEKETRSLRSVAGALLIEELEEKRASTSLQLLHESESHVAFGALNAQLETINMTNAASGSHSAHVTPSDQRWDRRRWNDHAVGRRGGASESLAIQQFRAYAALLAALHALLEPGGAAERLSRGAAEESEVVGAVELLAQARADIASDPGRSLAIATEATSLLGAGPSGDPPS